MGAKKLPAVGSLTVATWLDAVGYIGEELKNTKPEQCKTVGWLVAVNRQSITLASSLYEDETGDFTVIPRGVLLSARKAKE
jgi:hypothetical protein